MKVEYKSVDKKPYIQKVYEKFVMLFYSILGHVHKGHPFKGVMSVMIGKDKDGQYDCYLGIDHPGGFMPIAKFFKQSDAINMPEVDRDMSIELSELFYKMMVVEDRKTMADFDKSHFMPEFINFYPDADIK